VCVCVCVLECCGSKTDQVYCKCVHDISDSYVHVPRLILFSAVFCRVAVEEGRGEWERGLG
jgi:hypothetical protein